MGHRPADARLLSHLVSHEKDAAKARQALLAASQAALASLSAYAAASPPATSRTILNVAAVLSAADEACAKYAAAADKWRAMLRALHSLEEEVGSVIRDREILVTRLIKASNKSSSTSPSASSLTLHRLSLLTTPKLAAAQSELQACETHLAAKESELEIRRVQVVRDGLTLRAQAMAETGWTWSQLGQEAIKVVETELGYKRQDSHNSSTIVLGDYPVNTASTKAGELRIPAAYAIQSEIGMSIPVMNSSENSTPAVSRNNSVNRGPPVPSKGYSMSSESTPRAEHHRPHVAPHARVSWVSVTDTEEDWVDAGEGGEELDAVFGTPSNMNSSVDKKLPPAPPPLPSPYPYATAPGSIFDSEAYRTALLSSSSPTAPMAPPPKPLAPTSPLGNTPRLNNPNGAGAASLSSTRSVDGSDTENAIGSSVDSARQQSEVEYVGSATRHMFAVAPPSALKVVQGSAEGQQRVSPPPPLQPPTIWLTKAPGSVFDSTQGEEGVGVSKREEDKAEESSAAGAVGYMPNPLSHPAAERKETASELAPIGFEEQSTAFSSLSLPPPIPTSIPMLAAAQDDETGEYRGATHVLERSITEESVRAAGSPAEVREAVSAVKGEEEGAEEGAHGVKWRVVENPTFSTAAAAAAASPAIEGTSAVKNKTTKKQSSIRSALLAPVAGPVVVEEGVGEAPRPHEETAPPAIPATTGTTTTTTNAVPPAPSVVSSHKQGVFSRIFGRGKERQASVGSGSGAELNVNSLNREAPPPVPTGITNANFPMGTSAAVVVTREREVMVAPVVTQVTGQDGNAKISDGKRHKLSKASQRRKEEETVQKPHGSSGFFGGLRGFFGADLAEPGEGGGDGVKGKGAGRLKRKGGASEGSVYVEEALPPTATETIWTAPPVQQPAVAASSESPMKKRKHQRNSSLAMFFGLGHHAQAQESAVHAGEDGGEEAKFRVVENDVDMETRRERLQMQHGIMADTHAPGHGAKQGGVGRSASSSSKLKRRHLVHARRHSVGGADENEFGGRGDPHLVDVQAPGRLNVEEIQAQAWLDREAVLSAGAPSSAGQRGAAAASPTVGGVARGWPTRTDRNLKKLKAGDDDEGDAEAMRRYVTLAGGGLSKTRELHFEPVFIPDVEVGTKGLKGVEGVKRTSSTSAPVQPHIVDSAGVREEGGLSRNVSVTSNVSRKGSKLRKGATRSPDGQGQVQPPVQAAHQQDRVVSGGGYTSDTGAVGLGRAGSSSRSVATLKPRRSTSLTSPPPGIPTSAPTQNQYGATVLVVGGEKPTGNIARGGWGASLSRNNSARSSASAPVARSNSAKVKAQAALGQGVASGAPIRRSTIIDHSPAPGSRSASMVDITPVGSKAMMTGRGEKKASIPYQLPGVPGAVAAVAPITQMPVPKAPPSGVLMGGGGVNGGGSTSLLSIVEDVARGNRHAEEQMRVLKSGGVMGKMEMEVVQAPKRVHREMLGGAATSGGASSTASSGLVRRQPSTRPAQSPLKSALRNPSGSRTPSPMLGRSGGGMVPEPPVKRARRMSRVDGEDGGESSSYETPGDVSGDDGHLRKGSGVQQSQAQASTSRIGAPPPVGVNAPLTSSEVPQRRKSVRVSLQPTFSSTPPALYDDEDDARGRGYWRPVVPEQPTRRRSKFLTQSLAGPLVAPTTTMSGGARDHDIWQNSDEEDGEYARAKMLLSRARAEEKKVYATAAVVT